MPLAVALALFFTLAFVWPILRLRRGSGIWALVSHRGADPCQKLVGALMGLWFALIAGWVAALALVGGPRLGVWPAAPPLAWLGWALLAAGGLVVVAAQRQMGASFRIGIDAQPTTLVTAGPFAVVRNPIFTGMLAALGGVVALSPAAAAAIGWLAVAQLIALQVRLEEQHLLAVHGRAYADYAARVGRFVPALGRLSA